MSLRLPSGLFIGCPDTLCGPYGTLLEWVKTHPALRIAAGKTVLLPSAIEQIEGMADRVAKPHNAKWVRKIDGTPIPNDIPVSIFMYLKESELLDPPAPSVAVKALEWSADENHLQLQRADFYTIESEFREGFALHTAGTMGILWFQTEREAKAAAQADYEARIRSALA